MIGWGRAIGVVAVAAVAAIAIVTAPAAAHAVTNTELDKLWAMTPKQAQAYLSKHPETAVDLANSDSSYVDELWNDATPKERRKAVKSAPELIGNLEGVDYIDRDRANRLYLARALKATSKKVAAKPKDETAQFRLRALKAVKASLRATHRPRRYLVELTPAPRPLAAVAVGDPDTARQVAFDVPGMGTYSDDMQLWAQAAQNVYDEQGRAGAPADRSVVAWIGYVTPPPGIDATLGEYAAQGAPRLVSALEGFIASRSGGSDVDLSVIAHSYGTTTAANALASAHLGIFAFVMLGSAGVEESIRDARALHAEHVYAGEASGDTQAQWGRLSRRDPRAPSFGATILHVEGTATKLPVTNHEPIKHSNWNNNPTSAAYAKFTDMTALAKKYGEHVTTFGYLDAGTESLANTATATVRYPSRGLT
ncbi:MAG TPA: alpha/beta hydrolase [Humibacter sp.]|nr:alpha/beta hydrolase [Humibacter sp.]